MHLKEYIEKAKKELDAMEAKWIEENKKDPHSWPLDMFDIEWEEQEMAERFG